MKHKRMDWYKIIFCTLLLLVTGMGVMLQRTLDGQDGSKRQAADTEQAVQTPSTMPDEVLSGESAEGTKSSADSAEGTKQSSGASAEESKQPSATVDPAAGVYTFLQGPKSWKKRLAWSGKWGSTMYDGGSFGGFGCGLCCLANIYSTESEGECSPTDMYAYAKKYTEYGGGGAIAWEYMQQVLERTGFTAKLCRKSKQYKEFQAQIAESSCSIVLVSSADSDCYWKNTPGHYVTVFCYNQKKDQIFLADSGDPRHNRHWVSLKKIYRSLKTDSDYQYLRVMKYDQKKDSWKHTGTGGTWVRPDEI